MADTVIYVRDSKTGAFLAMKAIDNSDGTYSLAENSGVGDASQTTLLAVKAVTDVLPNAGALTDIAEDIEYAEEHVHHKNRWYGKKASQSSTLWGVSLSTGLSLIYRAISGAGVYGADANDEAQVLGSGDVVDATWVQLDINEILITANSSSTLYLNRIVWGSGTLADAVTAGQYSEFPYSRANSDTTRIVRNINTPLIAAGTKIWLQTMNATDNATIDFVVGIHGYTF